MIFIHIWYSLIKEYNMAGWNLKNGSITEYNVSEDRIWSLFNFVFSDSSKKRNTYKYGLIKSLLDCIFDGKVVSGGVYFSYKQLFARFAENYWNLVVKYDLRQMRKDGKSEYSKIEQIFKNEIVRNSVLLNIEFESIDDSTKIKIINNVAKECKKCVVGALYDDFDGTIYDFDLLEEGLTLNYVIYDFMQKHKPELEKLNYYSWARFLEQINDDNALIRLIDKLEISTPKRSNLSVYREILHREFEEDTCFYCGKLLQRAIHVDHFIPWSFTRADKMWNFVLSCPRCNERKNNKIPSKDMLLIIEKRNRRLSRIDNIIIENDFVNYTDDMIPQIWDYARRSGLKEFQL